MIKVTVFNVNKSKLILECESSMVVLPGDTGEVTILEFHQPMVTCLKKGIINIKDNTSLGIRKGIAKVRRDKLTIMVEPR